MPNCFSVCGEQRPGAAIEVGRRDDVVAGRGEVEHGIGRGGLARCDSERGGAALERGDALLEAVLVGFYARIDVAELVQRKQSRGVAGVLELVGRGLVNRHRHGPGRRIGAIASAMQSQRLGREMFERHGSLLKLQVRGWLARLRFQQVGMMQLGHIGMRAQPALKRVRPMLRNNGLWGSLGHSAGFGLEPGR